MPIGAKTASPDRLFGDMADVIWRDDHDARQRMALAAGPDAPRVLAGLQVHASTTHVTLARALAEAFPSVASAVPDGSFTALAQVFIAAHPPRRAALHSWGEEFPGFLSQQQAAPELIALACLDRAWLAALFAVEAAPIMTTCLTGLEATAILGMRFGTHPSLQLVSLDGPWLSSWLEGAAVPKMGIRWQEQAQGDRVALVRPRARVQAIALSPASFAFLGGLRAGGTLASACERGFSADRTFDLQGTLSALFAEGMFIECLVGEQT